MKCGIIPLLWRKFFFNIMNTRVYIVDYCNRPFNKFDEHCREWYFSHNLDYNEIRLLDNILNNIHKVMW